MHSVPTDYPVMLTDGVRTYEVFNATDYVNAVFGSGHSVHTPAPHVPAAPAPAAPAAPAAPVFGAVVASPVVPSPDSTDPKAK